MIFPVEKITGRNKNNYDKRFIEEIKNYKNQQTNRGVPSIFF